jgi:PKHD-type hydroxylase
MYALPAVGLENYASYAFFKDAFSKEECEKIKALFPKEDCAAPIGGGEINKSIRDASAFFVNIDLETKWIFDRLAKFALGCNHARWNFELKGFFEGLQLTKYTEGQHYDWHLDSGPKDFSIRKLSCVVQLSDESDYQGGELQFIDCMADKPQREQGTLILFPSYIAHRVTPVISGERKSLVAWITGDPYR